MNIAKLAILATVFVQDSSAKSYYESNSGSYYNDGVENADILDLDTNLNTYKQYGEPAPIWMPVLGFSILLLTCFYIAYKVYVCKR